MNTNHSWNSWNPPHGQPAHPHLPQMAGDPYSASYVLQPGSNAHPGPPPGASRKYARYGRMSMPSSLYTALTPPAPVRPRQTSNYTPASTYYPTVKAFNNQPPAPPLKTTQTVPQTQATGPNVNVLFGGKLPRSSLEDRQADATPASSSPAPSLAAPLAPPGSPATSSAPSSGPGVSQAPPTSPASSPSPPSPSPSPIPSILLPGTPGPSPSRPPNSRRCTSTSVVPNNNNNSEEPLPVQQFQYQQPSYVRPQSQQRAWSVTGTPSYKSYSPHSSISAPPQPPQNTPQRPTTASTHTSNGVPLQPIQLGHVGQNYASGPTEVPNVSSSRRVSYDESSAASEPCLGGGPRIGARESRNSWSQRSSRRSSSYRGSLLGEKAGFRVTTYQPANRRGGGEEEEEEEEEYDEKEEDGEHDEHEHDFEAAALAKMARSGIKGTGEDEDEEWLQIRKREKRHLRCLVAFILVLLAAIAVMAILLGGEAAKAVLNGGGGGSGTETLTSNPTTTGLVIAPATGLTKVQEWSLGFRVPRDVVVD